MNIFKAMEKELEKGNNLILTNGEVVNLVKFKVETLKEYTKGVSSGRIDIEKTNINKYLADKLNKCYGVGSFINDLKSILNEENDTPVDELHYPYDEKGGIDE